MTKSMIAVAMACLCGAAQSRGEEQVPWSYTGERGPQPLNARIVLHGK